MSDPESIFDLIDLEDGLFEAALEQSGETRMSDDELDLLLLEYQPDPPEELLQRAEQGLEDYPFEPEEMFQKLDEDGSPIKFTERDIIAAASQWYVRQEFRFYDVEKLGTPLSRFDLMQALAIRIRSTFTGFELTNASYKSILDVLLNSPTAAPGQSIPVWNGTTICKPGNSQHLLFHNGVVTINTWKQPAYRSLNVCTPTLGLFGELLEFIMPNAEERDVFLDWLSWCLQNEHDKPSWAIFLFSERHGTGKSTLAAIVKKLFGEENTSEQQGIKPLISRFNRPILSHKLIYAEEVKVAPNSDDGNKLKTLISERSTMAEAKGRDIAPIEHRCCFILTTNHKPIWLEPSDRRFYIIKIDHEGYSAGGKDYKQFVDLIGRVKRSYEDPQQVASLYSALKKRRRSADFNPYSLDVTALATEVMREINSLSNDIVEELLAEFIKEQRLYFIPVRYSQKIIEHFARRNPNAAKYTFDRLGWKKGKFAWGGKGPVWAFYDPQCKPVRGEIHSPYYSQSIEDYINTDLRRAMDEIGFGIAYETVKPNESRDYDDFG